LYIHYEYHSIYPNENLFMLRKNRMIELKNLYKKCYEKEKEYRRKITENIKRKEIEAGFKYTSSDNKLTSIDLMSLENVTIIGDNFLKNFNNLTEIDLSHLSKVKYIGNNFLQDCRELVNIDLTPLKNLTFIGDNFLNGCYKLQKIKFTQSQMIKFILHHKTIIKDERLGAEDFSDDEDDNW
jgi:hypothetical protein